MGNDENNIEESGKTFSLKKSGLLLASVLFIVIILLLTLYSCTISKEVKTDDTIKNQDEVVLVQDDLSSEKESEKGEKDEILSSKDENTSSEEVKDEGNVGEINEKVDDETTVDESEIDKFIENNKDSSENPINNENSESLFKVDEPVLGESSETSSLVSGKNVYRVGGTYYTYSLSLIIPDGEEYTIVKYFCSKRIYDEVSMGETINVIYQRDESGVISITSISR